MGLIGSIIGSAGSLAGGLIAGGISSRGYRQQQRLYEQRLKDIQAHRDKVYYADPTQTADAQAAATNAREILGEQARRAAATAAVAGGTDESAALQKAEAQQAVGRMLQQQAVQGEARKEQVYQNAEQETDQFTQYLAASKQQQAQQKAQAVSQAAGAFSQAAGLLPF